MQRQSSNLANSIGLNVIAEGVERKEHVDELSKDGYVLAQGYYYSRPLKVGAFEEYMKTVHRASKGKERRGEGISYFSLSITLAMAVGPFLGLYISEQGSFTMIFVACTLFSLISTIILLFVQIPEGHITKEQLDAMKGFKLKDFFEIKAVPIAIIIAIMGFAYSGILSFMTSYAKEIDLMEAASFFFIVYAVFILISRPFTGRLLDKKGDNIVMYPALILFVIGLVTLSQANQGFTLLLAGALIGLGFGTMNSCCQAIAVKESPRHRVGLATYGLTEGHCTNLERITSVPH